VSWGEVKLEDIFEIVRGGSPRPIDAYITEEDDGYNWISIKDASNSEKYIEKTKLKIKKEGLKKSRLVKPGDFLLTNSMSFGRPYIMKTTGCIHDGWLALSGDEKHVDSDYFYHLLSSETLRRKFASLAKGAVVKNLNINLVKSVEIPLPYPDDPEKSLKEQKRIATILDKADGIRRKRKQAIQLADDFLRSVFLDMFGDPVTNPKGWDVKPVGKICSCIVPGRDKPKSFTGGTPWVTTNDLDHLDVTTGSKKSIGLSVSEISEVKAKVVPKNSVLMTCVGDLGTVSIAGNDMVINQQLHAFLPNENVDPSFLSFTLSFQKGYMMKMASSTTLPYMNKTICNSVPIINPPIEAQKIFSEIVLKNRVVKIKFNSSIQEPIFESLSQKAFKGEL